MKIEIEVPSYTREAGLQFVWEDTFSIKVSIESDSVVIKADRGGLISLARHLLTLAEATVPAGCHFHLDDSNALDSRSTELIVAKA